MNVDLLLSSFGPQINFLLKFDLKGLHVILALAVIALNLGADALT
jgi:hypothetical protein